MSAEDRQLEALILAALKEDSRHFVLRKGCQMELMGGGLRSYERDLNAFIDRVEICSDFCSVYLIVRTTDTKIDHKLSILHAQFNFDGFEAYWESITKRADEMKLALPEPSMDMSVRRAQMPDTYGTW